MSLGKVNYLESGNTHYDRGFQDGLKANIMATKQRLLNSSDMTESYELLNRIRKLTKDETLTHDQRESRFIQVFNATQDFLMRKGMI